jgi:ABC-type nitrate/sulfonate/bicarbonate transport system substrate-binding protein
MLAHYGISPDEVNIVPGGNSTVPLLIAGKVDAADAAVGSEMFQIEEGAGKPVGMWLYTENGVPPFYSSVVAVNRKYLEEADPSTITSVAEGLQEAMQIVNQDPRAAFEISKENNPEIDVNTEIKAWHDLEPFQRPYKPGHPAGYIEPSIVAGYEKFAVENELVEGSPSQSELFTNKYLK